MVEAPPRAAYLLEGGGNDVVHTLMIDSEGFETVARRHREIDLADFPAIRAGMTQREKKRAFTRATTVRNVFDALADDDNNDNAALCPSAPQPCVVAETPGALPFQKGPASGKCSLATERRTQAPVSKECLEFPLERRIQAPASKECLGFPLTHDCVDDDKRRIRAPASKECLGFPLCGCIDNDDTHDWPTLPTRAPLQGADAAHTPLQGVVPEEVHRDLDDHALDDLCGLCNDDCPDMVFDEPDEFTLLQAQNSFARRAAFGTNGAAPGVQTLGSKPAKSGS